MPGLPMMLNMNMGGNWLRPCDFPRIVVLVSAAKRAPLGLLAVRAGVIG